MTAPYANIRIDVSEAIATLTIDRPAVKNALNRETVDECLDALRALAASDECGVLIVTGAGESSFVSGSDIGDIQTRTSKEGLAAIASSLCVAVGQIPAADDRGDQWLRSRGRLRAGTRVRHSHRLGGSKVRPARAWARHHPRRRRHAAPAARRRTRLGEASGPHRRDHRRQASARHRPGDDGHAGRPAAAARPRARKEDPPPGAPRPPASPSSPSMPPPASTSIRASSSRRWHRRSATTRRTSRRERPRSWRSESRSSAAVTAD